jgi:hypothetical protein
VQHQIVVDLEWQRATCGIALITTDQCLLGTLSHIELLIIGTDVRKVVLTIEDELVLSTPKPEKCRLPALPDVIPGIRSIDTNTVVARYRIDPILRILAVPYSVIAPAVSRNSFEIPCLETPRYSASHDLPQDLIV